MTLARGHNDANGRTPAAELCRLTILAGSVQVDVALPIDVPIGILVPGVVDLVVTNRTESSAPTSWTLSRIGMPPLSASSTLSESTIRDGELLILGRVEIAAPPPLFDDLMDSVARSADATHGLWTASTARAVASAVAIACILIACATLLRTPLGRSAVIDSDKTSAVLALVAGILMIAAGTVAGRVYHDHGVGVLLSGCALPLAWTSGVLLVPGELGSAHIVMGSTLTAVTAVLALRLGEQGTALFTGFALAALCATLGASVAMYVDVPPPTVGAVAVAVGFVGLALAPRLSMMQAHLPLPPVPTAGAPLDAEPEPDDSMFESLDDAARRARSFLSGLVCASAGVVVVGALLAAGTGPSEQGTPWPGVALAVLCALVLMVRTRTFAGALHALPMSLGGVLLLLALFVGAIVRFPASHTVMFGIAVAGAIVALFFGITVPGHSFSPVLRRMSEIAEYTAIAAIVPLVCWVCGLYGAVRGL